MRCLYRDPRWIGDVPVYEWLKRIHYMDTARLKGTQLRWLKGARVNPECPVDELSVDQRDRLVWQMLRFIREGGR